MALPPIASPQSGRAQHPAPLFEIPWRQSVDELVQASLVIRRRDRRKLLWLGLFLTMMLLLSLSMRVYLEIGVTAWDGTLLALLGVNSAVAFATPLPWPALWRRAYRADTLLDPAAVTAFYRNHLEYRSARMWAAVAYTDVTAHEGRRRIVLAGGMRILMVVAVEACPPDRLDFLHSLAGSRRMTGGPDAAAPAGPGPQVGAQS